MVGGLCFIVPGLVMIVALPALFLASHPLAWLLGAAAGAGAAVPAIALRAASGLVSWHRHRMSSIRAGSAWGHAGVREARDAAKTLGRYHTGRSRAGPSQGSPSGTGARARPEVHGQTDRLTRVR